MKALFQALVDAVKGFFKKLFARVTGKVQDQVTAVEAKVTDVTNKINDANP